MSSDLLPYSSPEEISARQLAARELAKYCQEFSRWRRTKRGSAAVDNSVAPRRRPEEASVKKPELPLLSNAA